MASKLNRILTIHGFDPLKTKIIDIETINGKSIVVVEYQNIKYKLDGVEKTQIKEDKKEIKEDKKEIKKPRGWHFRPVFVDVEGNVYHKGILQPELKDTLDPTP